MTTTSVSALVDARPARLRLLDGKVYAGLVSHVGNNFVRLTNGVRLTWHLDGYVSRPVGDRDFPACRVEWIRWR